MTECCVCWARIQEDIQVERCLSEPVVVAQLDYGTVTSPNLRARLDVPVQRNGVGHGLFAWFETDLIPGYGFSNGPGRPESVYGQKFLPWTEPVGVESGDCVEIRLDALLVNGQYVWRWRTLIRDAAGAGTKARFDQSSFYATAATIETFRVRSSARVPTLGEEGLVDRFILNRMGGTDASSVIAEAVCREFPEKFRTTTEAMGRVARLSAKYSR